MADETERPIPRPPHSGEGFIVVGLGASAGGIAPLREFFSQVPKDSGMAYVVILHLSAAHESTLPELLQTRASIPIKQVTEPVRVEANHVYVIPPAKYLVMSDGMIRLTDPKRSRGAPTSIDLFFRTLADAYGRDAIAIILSGTGTDGTVGLGRIKEQGGFVIVQDPSECEHPDMPRSAIEAGLVDLILPVSKMPETLLRLRDAARRLQVSDAWDRESTTPVELDEAALRNILALLRLRTGNDFSNYRRPTLLRRIARRMQVHELYDLDAYLQWLRDDPDEVVALLRDLLITVTNFFRDPEAFETLENVVIPQLFHNKDANDQVRVWTVGCATGEEAYSIAMLLAEHAARFPSPPRLQVFATDIDERAIAQAREGRYPDAMSIDVTPARLNNFFTLESNYYQVRKQLREQILFASHNVLRDPPFSKLDLVSCRNLLIYLNREMQERVLEIFHFAVRTDGFLFLGASESAETLPSLFAPVDKKQRIYRRRASMGGAESPPVVLRQRWQTEVPSFERNLNNQVVSPGVLHQEVVEQLAPPSVLINEEDEIIHTSASAGRYLRISGGEPTRNLIKLAHPALQVELRSALLEAKTSTASLAISRRARAEIDGTVRWMDLSVRRVAATPARAQGFFLVIFDEKEGPLTSPGVSGEIGSREVMEQLEQELTRTKDQLRVTIEQYETSTEELRASNEELQAINEELRSTTEELETSKEELQSVNEELSTLNLEYKEKIDEVGRANSDLQNLMASMDIATIFLDRTLRIRRYTPRAQQLFNIMPPDIGRPLEHFTHKLDYNALHEDAERVLRTLQPLEREVNSSQGHWYLARLTPYRTLDDKIDGVALTFVDITNRKQSEQQLENQTAELAQHAEIFNHAPVFLLDLDHHIKLWSKGCESLYGFSADEALGRIAHDLLKTQFPATLSEIHAELMEKGQYKGEFFQTAKDGSRLVVVSNWILHQGTAGRVPVIIELNSDVTRQRYAEQTIREADQNKDLFIATLAHELRNPLGAISSSIELLRQGLNDEQTTARALDILNRQLGNLIRIVDDLLDVERLSRGRILLRKDRMPLGPIIEAAVENCQEAIESRRHHLVVSLSQEPVFLEGDATRLAQVISNLLDNACKYTPPGGEVRIVVEKEADTVTIRVLDNGIGISPEGLARVFNVYFQGEPSPGAELKGLGIGLALVRQLTEMHGGTVSARSDGLGKGSEFSLTLPTIEPLTPQQVWTDGAPSTSGLPVRTGRKVLIIDDNVDSAEAMGLVLETEGHQTKIVHDGRSALVCAKDFAPDVAIIDIGLPGMDGYEVAVRLRQLIPQAKLLALSGWRVDSADHRARTASFDDFFTKPLQLAHLREVLAQINHSQS